MTALPKIFQFLHGHHPILCTMDHSVAVRAEADEIRPGIDRMALIDRAQGLRVMNLDKALTQIAIMLCKIEPTNRTGETMNPDCFVPELSVTFKAGAIALDPSALYDVRSDGSVRFFRFFL